MGVPAKSPAKGHEYRDEKNLWLFAVYHSNELGSGILSARGEDLRDLWIC